MPVTNCRYFNGYKPCGKSSKCDHTCSSQSVASVYILMIHLGAIGAVVRSTSLLSAIHRKYPGCHLTWVTDQPSHVLLKDHPLIDQVYTTNESDLLELSALEFDIALVIDKSKKAAGVLARTYADQVFGFRAEPRTGAILPATAAAKELWMLGLDNQQKFFVNKKTENQLIHEALELGSFQNDAYDLRLSKVEQEEIQARKIKWKKNKQQILIGINTGASPTIPYKKLSVENHIELIQKLQRDGFQNLVLLGGKEDTLRNSQIAQQTQVLQSTTELGLRDGLISVQACDLVISGDSLGMHMAIASGAYVIAWFGPTCAHEIELYGQGQKIQTTANCAPCWKRHCNEEKMCYDLVNLEEIIRAVHDGVEFCNKKQTYQKQINNLSQS